MKYSTGILAALAIAPFALVVGCGGDIDSNEIDRQQMQDQQPMNPAPAEDADPMRQAPPEGDRMDPPPRENPDDGQSGQSSQPGQQDDGRTPSGTGY